MDLEWLIELISLPPAITQLLERKIMGNSVLQYGLFACVLLCAWGLAFLASYGTRKGLDRVLQRLDAEPRERIVTAIRRPVRILAFCMVAWLGASILTHEVSETDAHQHWVHMVFSSGFNIGTRLSIFWVVARLLELGWYEWLFPIIDRNIEGDEKRFFPVAYRLVAVTLWVFAVANCTPVLGYDARELLIQVLSAEALHNTIGQYLAFLGLLLLTLLLARTAFKFVHKNILKFTEQRARQLDLEEDWFEAFERPLMYFITLFGFRLATGVLSNGDGTDLHDIATIAVDVCLTVDLTWVFFILTDKIYEKFIFPLASSGPGGVDEQLLILTRKVAKAGIGAVGGIFLIKATGKDPVAVLAGLGIGGVAIGFAAKDTISPFMGGIAIYLTHPFRMGDYIGVDGGLEGRVVDIGLRATTLETKMGTTYVIPNDKIINAPIHNTQKNGKSYDGICLRIDIGTTPDKRDAAIELFKQAVIETDGAGDPQVHFLSYGDDNLGLMLSYWIDDASTFWDVRHNIMMKVDTRLRELRVEMSLPTRAISFSGYLPEGPVPQINVGQVAASMRRGA